MSKSKKISRKEQDISRRIQNDPELRKQYFAKQNIESLKSFASMGLSSYEVMASSDSCKFCKKLDGKAFRIADGLSGKSPVPPFGNCANAGNEGCGCTVVPSEKELTTSESDPHQPTVSVSECPACGNTVMGKARKCSKCGHPIKHDSAAGCCGCIVIIIVIVIAFLFIRS